MLEKKMFEKIKFDKKMLDNVKIWLHRTVTNCLAFLGKAARQAGKKIAVFLKKAAHEAGKWLVRFGRRMLPILKKMAPSVLLGAVLFILLFWTGIGDKIGQELAALTGPVPALFIIFAICLIPSVSPVLGPGLLIAIAAAIFTGEQIAGGAAKPVLALAALLALDTQLGGSFIPPRLVLGENEPETISAGVPGIVFTRLITIPIAVVLACLFTFL